MISAWWLLLVPVSMFVSWLATAVRRSYAAQVTLALFARRVKFASAAGNPSMVAKLCDAAMGIQTPTHQVDFREKLRALDEKEGSDAA